MYNVFDRMNTSWMEKISESILKRKSLRSQTNAMRLVNGRGDGLDGLIIDQYHHHYRILIYQEQWMSKIENIKKYLVDRLGAHFILFRRGTREGREEVLYSFACPGAIAQTVVTENDLKFSVDLADQFNAGLFLDMRANRKRLSAIVSDRSVLNCFSYTCSFGVYSRMKSARRVVNVDISKKALDWGQKNYSLNKITASEDEFVRKDIFGYLKRADKILNFFDIIILDPPSFSRFQGKTFTARKDLAKLVSHSVKILNPKGHLFLSTNDSGLETRHLSQMLERASIESKKEIRGLTPMGQDFDFSGSGKMKESHLAAVLAHFG